MKVITHLSEEGLTLAELVIAIALFSLLAVIGVGVLVSPQSRGRFGASKNLVISTLQIAQEKSVSGETAGGSEAQNFGVHFETDQYVLFVGASYNPNATTNQFFELERNISFTSINFPAGNIIFDKGSGEVTGFDQSQNSVTLTDSGSGESTTLTINKAGVVND